MTGDTIPTEPTEQYAKYRERHTIDPVTPDEMKLRGIGGGYYVCRHDGIRLFRRQGPGGWAHWDDAVRKVRLAATPVGWPR